MLIVLRFFISLEVHINVHYKATAKNHRATNMRDHSLYVSSILDLCKPKARIAEIVKCYSFETLQNSREARNAYVCFIVVVVFVFRCCCCCLFICFSCSADRQSEIGDRKLESWTLGIVKD